MDDSSDPEWDSEDESESSAEEEEGRSVRRPFYPCEFGETPIGVGMPNFWYNGECYYWTERNLRCASHAFYGPG